MHLQKTSGPPAVKTTVEKAPGNVKTEKAQTTEAKPSIHSSSARSVSSLIAATGLPADKLSASIISFARFFSLSLKPELLAEIRREVLSQPMPAQADPASLTPAEKTTDPRAAKAREVFSMAAAAAESKGAELHAKGLDWYAEALDPEWPQRQEAEGQNRKQNKKQDEKDGNNLFKSGEINPFSLEKMALQEADKNPLLYVLNRLPAKNGQHWIVIPFNLNDGEIKYRIAMRLLLDPEQKQNRSVLMALDIAEETTGNLNNRSSFVLTSENNKLKSLSVFYQSELPPNSQFSLKRKLSDLLGIPADRITIKKLADNFFHEADEKEDSFASVDKAV